MAVVVKGTCSRLCEEERRSVEGALRLIRNERYEGEQIGEYDKLRYSDFEVDALLTYSKDI